MRKDQDPEDRDSETLKLPAILECPECSTVFDHVFDAGEGVYDLEDLIDQPVDEVQCPNPNCGTKFTAEYEGWVAHSDAG